MTGAQVATLARRGVVPERDLTWVQASLLIDHATGAHQGKQAATWLRENGASPEEAAEIIQRAERNLHAQSGGRPAKAVAVSLEVLEAAAREGRGQSGGEGREQEALERSQVDAVRSRQQQRRQAWAQRGPATESRAVAASAANRASLGRSPPRTAR